MKIMLKGQYYKVNTLKLFMHSYILLIKSEVLFCLLFSDHFGHLSFTFQHISKHMKTRNKFKKKLLIKLEQYENYTYMDA